MIDKDNKTKISTLDQLNQALAKLNPAIAKMDEDDFGVRGIDDDMLDQVIPNNKTVLYDGIETGDIVSALEPALKKLVEDQEAGGFIYDTHGKKHFPGGPEGTKFNGKASTVNPKLVKLIEPHVGRIRRDANGKKALYYLTTKGIPECGKMDLTIQIDYNADKDSFTYHGYPDDNVSSYSLSRKKGGPAIKK